MRFLLLLFLISCGGLAARAQQQDPGLLLQTRNQDLASKMFQNKSFYEGKVFEADGKANVKSFYTPQRFEAGEFGLKNFRTSTFSQRDLLVSTKEARTKTDTRDDKLFETKSAAVKDARESGTRDYANTREFHPEGKSQKSLDQTGKKKLSIDEVRELLNKNK